MCPLKFYSKSSSEICLTEDPWAIVALWDEVMGVGEEGYLEGEDVYKDA